MAYKKVGGFEQLPMLDLLRDGEGTVTEFKLLSFKTGVGKFNSNIYTVEEKVSGEKQQFWGNAVLDARLPECTVGNMIKVIYLGEQPSKEKGKQPFKNFDVFEDDGSDGPDESAASATSGEPKKTIPF